MIVLKHFSSRKCVKLFNGLTAWDSFPHRNVPFCAQITIVYWISQFPLLQLEETFDSRSSAVYFYVITTWPFHSCFREWEKRLLVTSSLFLCILCIGLAAINGIDVLNDVFLQLSQWHYSKRVLWDFHLAHELEVFHQPEQYCYYHSHIPSKFSSFSFAGNYIACQMKWEDFLCSQKEIT